MIANASLDVIEDVMRKESSLHVIDWQQMQSNNLQISQGRRQVQRVDHLRIYHPSKHQICAAS